MIKETSMMDSFICRWLMVTVSIQILKDRFMMDNGNLTNKMDKALKSYLMDQYSKEITQRVVNLDMVK